MNWPWEKHAVLTIRSGENDVIGISADPNTVVGILHYWNTNIRNTATEPGTRFTPNKANK